MNIRYAVFAEDKINHPQQVWNYPTKDEKRTLRGMAFGPATEGVFYNGERLAAFGSFEHCARVAKALKGRLERWEYENGVRVRVQHVNPHREEDRLNAINKEAHLG